MKYKHSDKQLELYLVKYGYITKENYAKMYNLTLDSVRQVVRELPHDQDLSDIILDWVLLPKKQVYFSGSMTGNVVEGSYEDRTKGYDIVADMFERFHLSVFRPWRDFEPEDFFVAPEMRKSLNEFLVKRDEQEVRRCDIFFAYVDKPSLGVGSELAWIHDEVRNHNKRKRILVSNDFEKVSGLILGMGYDYLIETTEPEKVAIAVRDFIIADYISRLKLLLEHRIGKEKTEF